MEDFFRNLHEAIVRWKPWIVSIIGGIALWQIFIAWAVGGHDRRQTIVNVFGLIVFAALIMYSDHFFDWLRATFK